MKRVATQFGHELLQVTTGAEVLRSANTLMPDLIVLDVSFPDADGRDLLAQFKADERTRDIPVLVWSAPHDRDSASRIALSLGAEDYVEKESAQLLMRKIERILLRIEGPSA